MTLLCGRSVTWGSDLRINSSELTELNYIFFRIACYNIFPISHVHTIPIDRCFFLYALVIDASICFPSLFIQTLAEAHRSKCKKHGLFFPVFIYRVLYYLHLENFPSLELIHITALIGATFLKHSVHKRRMLDQVLVHQKDHEYSSPQQMFMLRRVLLILQLLLLTMRYILIAQLRSPSFLLLSLRAMMETFMTTQAAHEQLLDGLIVEVVALRADFSEYRSAFPPPLPSDS